VLPDVHPCQTRAGASRWMTAELAPVVHDGLRSLAARGWIERDAPARVWQGWTSGRTHWSRPWGLAILGHFLDVAHA